MAQSGHNVRVAFKLESTYNTPPGDTDGYQLRLNSSPGLTLARPTILPGELRRDQLQAMGRLGSRSVGGGYNADISADPALDVIWEALWRSTWAAALTLTSSEMTSITIANQNQIVASAGSWLTEGIRVGDIVRLTDTDEEANDNLNLIVTAVTASTITVYGEGSATPLTDNAVADTGFTLTRLRKLANAATPTKRTFYVEEYYQDIDESLVNGGQKWATFRIIGSPDGMATVELGLVGASQSRLESGAAPYFTDPSVGSNPGLAFADAQILLNGSPLLTATAFELSGDLNASTLPVIGSTVSPGVFDNTKVLTGSLSILREDLARVASFGSEAELQLAILLQEPTGTPKKAVSFFLPRIKFTGASAPIGEEGGMVETLPFIVGAQAASTGLDAGVMTMCTETHA